MTGARLRLGAGLWLPAGLRSLHPMFILFVPTGSAVTGASVTLDPLLSYLIQSATL